MYDSEFIHIPIEEATVPKNGATVLTNRYWSAMKDGHISIYVGRSKPNAFGMYSIYSPQCNQSKAVADRIFNKSHFIPAVFFIDKLRT